MTSPDSIDPVLFERILQTAASPSAIDQLCRKHNLKFRRGIYHLAVVVWLMIYQRLHGKGTLSVAVHFLAHQVVHWQAQPHMSKRVREDRISTRTGGYCQARQKMPTLVASHVCDHISEQLAGADAGTNAGRAAADVCDRRHHLALAARTGVGESLSARTQPARRKSLADPVAGGFS